MNTLKWHLCKLLTAGGALSYSSWCGPPSSWCRWTPWSMEWSSQPPSWKRDTIRSNGIGWLVPHGLWVLMDALLITSLSSWTFDVFVEPMMEIVFSEIYLMYVNSFCLKERTYWLYFILKRQWTSLVTSHVIIYKCHDIVPHRFFPLDNRTESCKISGNMTLVQIADTELSTHKFIFFVRWGLQAKQFIRIGLFSL